MEQGGAIGMIDWKNGAAMAVSERDETHSGDGDGGAAAWLARGKASESERARNGLSTASPHSSPRYVPIGWANADVLPPHSTRCLWPVGHRRVRGCGHQG